jgi:methyl-accepting chemotaxis protein
MNNSFKLSFKSRLLVGFTGIIIAVVVALVIAIGSLRRLVDVNEKLDESFQITRLVAQMRADNTRIRTLLLEAVDPDYENPEEILSQISDELKQLFSELEAIEKGIAGNEEAMTIFRVIKEKSQVSRELRERQIELVKNRNYAEAEGLFRGTSYTTYEEVYQKSNELEKVVNQINEQLKNQADSLARSSNITLLIIGVIVLVFTVFIVVAIFRMITRISKELKEGITVLGSSTSEIQTTVAEISTGAAETATAISETTTTIEEIRQTSMVAGKKAKNLLETSQKASDIGERGLETSQQMVDSMNRIDAQMQVIQNTITKLSEQNRSIGEITSTVADIADQSNLLAVNAAIEAAKAGEHGRGFSVVAQEIRSLAEQSKKSTAQVKEILNEIQKSVTQAVEVIKQGKDTADEGTKMVQEDREVVEMLIESVTEAVEASVQISSSSQQQMAGMDQIVPAMENIKQASEQNVAGIRQTQDAAKNLFDLGETLKHVIERYRL